MDSLRNSDILSVIESKVPERLAEIDKERKKMLQEISELEQEQAKLFAVMDATKPDVKLVREEGKHPRVLHKALA